MGMATDTRAGTLRVYCLPHAGGSAQMFADWATHAPAWLEPVPLELPGRGRRFHEDPIGRLEPLVADLMGTVLSGTVGRFALFGHSYGALLAFELCRRLEHYHGLVAEHLFVAALRGPGFPRAGMRVSGLPDEAFREHLRALGGTPPEVLDHEALMEMLLPVLRADFAVVDDYAFRGGQPVGCPVTAIGGLEDVRVSRQALEAWGRCCCDRFQVRMLPGGHFFPRSQRDSLLSLMAGELTAAVDHGPGARRGPGLSMRSPV